MAMWGSRLWQQTLWGERYEKTLSGVVVATSSTTALLNASFVFSGNVSALSTTTSNISLTLGLFGTCDGLSVLTGTLGQDAKFSGYLSTSSNVYGHFPFDADTFKRTRKYDYQYWRYWRTQGNR